MKLAFLIVPLTWEVDRKCPQTASGFESRATVGAFRWRHDLAKEGPYLFIRRSSTRPEVLQAVINCLFLFRQISR
jgi:hypothetical protein